jgi:hypothetical protein
MLNLISFSQTSKANIDQGVRQLNTNNVTQAGFILIRMARLHGKRATTMYRVEDGFKTKANGKHLVYFYADCTKYPTQYNYLLPDGASFSKYCNEAGFISYLNKRVQLENRLGGYLGFNRGNEDEFGEGTNDNPS